MVNTNRLQNLLVLGRELFLLYWSLWCLDTIGTGLVNDCLDRVLESWGESFGQEVDGLGELGLGELVACVGRSLDD